MLIHFLHILPISKHFIISRQKAAWGLLKLKFFRRKFLADTSAIRGREGLDPLPLKKVDFFRQIVKNIQHALNNFFCKTIFL